MNHQCQAHSPYSQACPAHWAHGNLRATPGHDINYSHLQMAPAWGCQGAGMRVHTSRGKPWPTPPWLSRDHGTLPLGQEGAQAKETEVEQTGSQAGREKGGAESAFHPEKVTHSSHRKTSKARTTDKV